MLIKAAGHMQCAPTTTFKFLTVTEFIQCALQAINIAFPDFIGIEGEIANFITAASGHCYFTLKDKTAQVRCILFKRSQTPECQKLQNGLRVLVRAKPTLYEPRGEFQLIIESIEAVGSGVLQKKIEQLKIKLDKEGLFNPDRKRKLPLFPQTIGIVTSPAGAALRDVLSILKRRWPIATAIIYPTSVQGETAAAEIAHALQIANDRKECEVIILCRGGGSLEDLMAFNEESVARALFKSSIPIITGIGHRTDTTIADLVADYWAATPSEAAEIATQFTQKKVLEQLQVTQEKIVQLLLTDILQKQNLLKQFSQRLNAQHPRQTLSIHHTHLLHLEKNLFSWMEQYLSQKKLRLNQLNGILSAMNPLAVLDRGYSILTDEFGHIIKDSQSVKINDPLQARLAKGILNCRVEKINTEI